MFNVVHTDGALRVTQLLKPSKCKVILSKKIYSGGGQCGMHSEGAQARDAWVSIRLEVETVVRLRKQWERGSGGLARSAA
jgi:hypothetical protein